MRKLALVCMIVLGTGVALAQSVEKQATSITPAAHGQTAGERTFDDALIGYIVGGRAEEPCPADSISGQYPSSCSTGAWYFYSDLNFCSGTMCSRVRCENFPKTGLLDPNDPNDAIGTIRWFGVNVTGDNANGCSKGEAGTYQFRIRFYSDAAGVPNPAYVYEEVVTPYMTNTGETVQFSGATIPAVRWMYTAVLSTPQHMAKGWFSICGQGAPDCWSLWEGSGADGGDNLFYQWFEQNGDIPGPPVTTFCDLDYCFGVLKFGACCDDRTATCQENLAEIACVISGGRFHHNLTCDSFGDPNDPNNPACGEAPGACCHDDGTCEIAISRVCVPTTICRGDCDCDGDVDFDDINPLVAVLSGGPCCDPTGENCDVNNDGVVDFDDINAFVAVLGQPCTRSERSSLWLGPFSACDRCCKLDCADPNLGVTHHELELCGQDLNGGCNSHSDPNDPNSPPDPAAWEDLGILDPNHPTVVCGTLWAENEAGDTDWYTFQLPLQGTLTWESLSDIPLLTTPVFADGHLGAPTMATCTGSMWGFWDSTRSYLCDLGGTAAPDLFPGAITYWWIAFPNHSSAFMSGFPCADNWTNYRLTITTVPLVCDPCLASDRQENETECAPPDALNSGCDSADGNFYIDPNNSPLLPATYYCGKAGTWADPNGNTLVDYDWWKIVLSGTVRKRLQIQMRAGFNMQWELYSVPGDVCANKVRLDYYEFGVCESNVTIYTTCLEPNNSVYYMRIVPLSTVSCMEWNHYRFQYALLSEAPPCTTCNVVCSTSVDNQCQSDPNAVDTNQGCNAADPNAAANYMAYVAGNNTYGAKYCGRISTFTASDGARVDLDWFRYTQLAARTKLVVRGKAMFRMSINVSTGCSDPGTTHGWDRPCKGAATSATQTWTGLTAGTQYTGVIIYGNGGGDGTGEQVLKQFFFGLPCSDNRNTYELELQCQT